LIGRYYCLLYSIFRGFWRGYNLLTYYRGRTFLVPIAVKKTNSYLLAHIILIHCIYRRIMGEYTAYYNLVLKLLNIKIWTPFFRLFCNPMVVIIIFKNRTVFNVVGILLFTYNYTRIVFIRNIDTRYLGPGLANVIITLWLYTLYLTKNVNNIKRNFF